MSDRTQFAIGRHKVGMPRVLKRSLQVVISAALTAGVVLAIVLSSTMLTGRGSSLTGLDLWFSFIKRNDIIGTMILTALVTVAFVYWQRDRERH